MGSLSSLTDFLQGKGYRTFSELASFSPSSSFGHLFNGQDLTVFIPSDDAFLTVNNNTRGYNFNLSSPTWQNEIIDVLSYHAVFGQHDLDSIPLSPTHTLLDTAIVADVGKNQTQKLVLQRSIPPDQQEPVVEFLNQLVQPRILMTAVLNSTTIYGIDTVLGVPANYSWETNNTRALAQWNTFENMTVGPKIDEYDGYTLFAPADDAWDVTKFAAQIPDGKMLSVYLNHVIIGTTVWSSNFTAANYTSASGFGYTFNETSNGTFTISLDGITVNITRSDILTNNGVIHLLDGPLWTSQDTTSVSDPSGIDHTAKGGLSTGAIVGIAVAAVVAFLSALTVLYGLYKRRQRHVKVLAHHEESECIDEPDLPTAALRTTPFPSSHDLTEPRSSETATNITPQGKPSEPSEKRKAPSSHVDQAYRSGSASPSGPERMTEFSQMSQEVMERLLQSISIRIDSADAPPETNEAPPEYFPTR